uniref:Uncharacterized protein n=1 Tax=uncultured Caudovirales phage TaxID=2100421 RepID=A0A6J5L514_9CAUD|nr:hypothetical protein UFOVP114_51 [uncultured Caudovirales phage]
MPSSILLNGRRIFSPGVYGNPNFSALSGKSAATGIVVIVGYFPELEQNVPHVFFSAKAAAAAYPSNGYLQRVVKTLFSPAREADNVPTGASQVVLVNFAASTAASKQFQDADGNNVLKLAAQTFGPVSNQLAYKLASTKNNTKALDVELRLGSVVEKYNGIESAGLVALYYDGADGLQTHVAFSPSAFQWNWGKQVQLPGDSAPDNFVVWNVVDCVIYGKLNVEVDLAPTMGKTITVTVQGVDKLGLDVTGTLVLHAGETTGVVKHSTTEVEWRSITSVRAESDEDGVTPHVTYTAKAFDFDLTSFLRPPTVGALASLIGQSSNKGFQAKLKSPQAFKVPSNQMDTQTSVGVDGSSNSCDIRADLWAVVNALSQSSLVTATRLSGAAKPLKFWNVTDSSEQGLFLGGGVSGMDGGGDDPSVLFQASLDVLKLQDGNIVILALPIEAIPGDLDNDTAVLLGNMLAQHCVDAALYGFERNAYLAVLQNGGTAPADVRDIVQGLNTRHVTPCFQQVKIEDETGNITWQDQTFQALQLAGIQAGVKQGKTMVMRKPNVYATRQKWTPVLDDEQLLACGALIYSVDPDLGIIVKNDATSWVQDDNPALSSITANESVNKSIRDVRANFKILLGDNTADVSAAALTGKLEDILEAQVKKLKIIKAWRNASVEDLGDRFRLNYGLAPGEVLRFIEVAPEVARFTTT